MTLKFRDKAALEKVVQYCDEIDETKEFFGDSKEKLTASRIYKNALAMCVLQIGELTTVISDEFKQEHSDIPWGDIKKMRNIAAHRYGDFSNDFLWDTASEDIGELRDYCKKCLFDADAVDDDE
jgi:uncharacterized protein with HEPN domain